MKNNSLVPRLRKKFECLKLEEISGWRKESAGSKQDLHPMTKFPALLKDRSDYHKQLIYPHWNLNPVSSETIKHSNSKRKLEIFPLQGREEVLDYEKQAEFERIQGKNIIIGSVTTRNLPVPTATYAFISSKPGEKQGMRKNKSDNQLLQRKRINNFVQFTIGYSESEENKSNKLIQYTIGNDDTGETSGCQNKEENLAQKNEILIDMLNNSTSRTASAIVFGSKKTMFDVYSSAMRKGSVKNKNDAEKLVNDMLNKGVLVKDSQKSKLFMRKNEDAQEFESLNSSVSSISPKFEPVFRKNNERRDSLAYKSEIEHSSLLSRDEGCESLSTNITGSMKKSQESVKRSLKLDSSQSEAKNYSKTVKIVESAENAENLQEKLEENYKKSLKLKHAKGKQTNRNKEKNLNIGVKVKDLAMIEIIDSDDDLIDKRSKSVINFYENKSIAGSLNHEDHLKKMPDKKLTSGVVVFQKKQIPEPTDAITSQKTPEKPKILQKAKKTPKNSQDKSLKKKVKKVKSESNQDKNNEVNIPSIKPQKTPEEPIPKEKIAERILAEYKKVPKKSSISLDIIHENPKKIEKKPSKAEILPQLKLGRKSSVETPKKENYDFRTFKRSSVQNFEDSANLLKKRSSALTPRSSFAFREVLQKDQKYDQKEVKDSKQVSSESKDLRQVIKDSKQLKDPTDANDDQPKILIRKPTNSDKSYKSSFSYRTDDFNDKSISRSSSFKKNLVTPVVQIKPKKVRKIRKREEEEESSQEISDYEENLESSMNMEKSRSKLKKKSIIYEIDQLDKNKENTENKEKPSKNLQKSVLASEPSSLESDSDDLDFDLSQLMQNKNFSINKFSFSPQVIFRFSQRMDRNTYLNVNDIEINEYNIDHDNFESYINKKRFNNGANTVMGVYRSNNKLLEILDVDEYLPVQVHRKKLKEFERIRKKDLILQARGKVAEISKKPKFTFSGLESEKVKKKNRTAKDKEIKDEDIIRSGGSLTVRDEMHLNERLYCRVKDVFNLESISGINSNSAERIIKSLKTGLCALERRGKKINL